MQPADYPELRVPSLGCCTSDGSRTHTQLPSGDYLCPACVHDYRECGWLGLDYEYTSAFWAAHPHRWGVRLRRKAEGRVVIDPERVAAALRQMLTSGTSVEEALRRLQSEGHVDYSLLARALGTVSDLQPREARRLVVQAVGSSWPRKQA